MEELDEVDREPQRHSLATHYCTFSGDATANQCGSVVAHIRRKCWTYASQMAQTNPSRVPVASHVSAECIQACFDCAQACTACADACLGEQEAKMVVRCIRLDLDCADVCMTTGKVLSRQTAFDPQIARAVLQACATTCKLCGDECAMHAQHGMQHCATCAEACRRCAQACNALLQAIAA